MAFTSVSYTFVNGNTADGTAVNQNFTDILNGLSDTTKDLSIFALTCASTATFNGNVTFGNGSVDDITFNGSIASSIPVKTNNSFDIGSATLGLAGVYYGASGGFSTRLISGATTSHTITLPPTAGSEGQVLRNIGTGVTQLSFHSGALYNVGLATSVAANALTILLKGTDGNDPSSSNRVTAIFRNATATTGIPSAVSATAATSITISSGSTLGHASGQSEFIYVYLINNSGTLELAVSGSCMVDENSVVTTTAEGGAGAADSKSTLYSTTARSNVPARLIGRIKSNQATAGTWASAPTEISVVGNKQPNTPSEVWVYTANGYGSTNNKIIRWTTVGKNIGTGITLTQSATEGDSFTINEYGVYACSLIAQQSAAQDIGISLNSTQLTTNIASITATDRVADVQTAGANLPACAQVTLILNPGDIIRPHTAGTTFGSATYADMFRIVQVARL